MTLVSLGRTTWPPAPIGNNPSLGAFQTIDAASEIAGVVMTAPRTGSLRYIHFRTGNVTTGGTNDLDLRIETVDGNGDATGTLWGTNTNIAHNLLDTDDSLWLPSAALTADASVTAGDVFAIVIANPAANFATANISATQTALTLPMTGFPYSLGPLRSDQVDQTIPVIMAEYTDGSFAVPEGLVPTHVATTVAINTGTNPDEVALYFTALGKMRVIGWWGIFGAAAGGDWRVNLYESGNNTPLATCNRDGDVSTSTSIRGQSGQFSSPVTLTNGSVYRLGLTGTTANSVTLRYYEVSSTYPLVLDELAGRSTMHYSSRDRTGTTDPDAAAWAQVGYRRPWLGLIIDQIDDGAAAGGGVIASGGMHGGFA